MQKKVYNQYNKIQLEYLNLQKKPILFPDKRALNPKRI